MTTKPPNPRHTGRNLPEPPKHLGAPERHLWSGIVSNFEFGDPASIALLSTAMDAHARARRCREQIAKDGEAVKDRWGQIRVHPLLAAERDARASFISAMRALHLDLGIAS